MKILLTGATGYIGKRILPLLLTAGHQVICCVRDKNRFVFPKDAATQIDVIEVDFLKPDTLMAIPDDIDVAYYLMHSMSSSANYDVLENTAVQHFVQCLNQTKVQQVIYLSGIVNDAHLSKHLSSRKNVEQILTTGRFATTVLRAGIIIGSGSASFEIIRDLVDKLPIMIAPRWLNTRCQPIAIADVLQFLTKSLLNPLVYNNNFDIGGPDILTYKEMLLGFANARHLKRRIFVVPVMTPKLSSYWLYFVTSTSFKLASALVSSMKVEVICRDHLINDLLAIQTMSFKEAVSRALLKINQHEVASSWKDALVSGVFSGQLADFQEIPTTNCFQDKRSSPVDDVAASKKRIWSLGGETGWYYADWLWRIRGIMDKMCGGVGLRRGRTNESTINAGDALDFWRVLYVSENETKLVLFAEMKLPGKAWLAFEIKNKVLYQTATFAPEGVWGKLYWYAVLPFHGLIFQGMIDKLSGKK